MFYDSTLRTLLYINSRILQFFRVFFSLNSSIHFLFLYSQITFTHECSLISLRIPKLVRMSYKCVYISISISVWNSIIILCECQNRSCQQTKANQNCCWRKSHDRQRIFPSSESASKYECKTFS